jgi:hypothetical protein
VKVFKELAWLLLFTVTLASDTTKTDLRLGAGIEYLTLPSQSNCWGLELRGESRYVGVFLGGGGFERYEYWGNTEFRSIFPYLGVEFFPISFPRFRGGVGILFQPEIRRDPVFPFIAVGFYFPMGSCKNWGWFLQGRAGRVWSVTFGTFWRPPDP